MKTLRFLIDCHDKFTEESYPAGTVREFEDARADEILEIAGAAEFVSETDETETDETEKEEKKAEKGKSK